MKITIDPSAGFCPGVNRAIRKAEKALDTGMSVHSYGSLLHNEIEMQRLEYKGLTLACKEDISSFSGETLLIRAHGEPPETYIMAAKHQVNIIDATCGVVSRLQRHVARAAGEMEKVNGQVLIFGKYDHPEVVGLLGHTRGLGIAIANAGDQRIDHHRPVRIFSQTTMDGKQYEEVSGQVLLMMKDHDQNPDFIKYNTICHHVARRIPLLKQFASQSEVIVFVSGRESSNGKKLFKVCALVNSRTYFISGLEELKTEWFRGVASIGISGAASTPQWLMKKVEERIREII